MTKNRTSVIGLTALCLMTQAQGARATTERYAKFPLLGDFTAKPKAGKKATALVPIPVKKSGVTEIPGLDQMSFQQVTVATITVLKDIEFTPAEISKGAKMFRDDRAQSQCMIDFFLGKGRSRIPAGTVIKPEGDIQDGADCAGDGTCWRRVDIGVANIAESGVERISCNNYNSKNGKAFAGSPITPATLINGFGGLLGFEFKLLPSQYKEGRYRSSR